MPAYKFKAQKSDGTVYEGVKEAIDKFALYRDLKSLGETVLSTEETKTTKFNWHRLETLFTRFSTRDKINFARNLGSMLQAGLSLTRALSVIERQTTKKGVQKVISTLNEEIGRGKSLSEGLKLFPSVFPSLFTSMVRAGEESGSLSDSLKTVAEQMNSTYSLQKKVKGAMIYPAVIICVMIAIGILMLIYVVPNITAVFKEQAVELPWNTKLIIFVSELIKNNYILASGALFLVLGGLYMFKRTNYGKRTLDYAFLKLPAVGSMVKQVNSARTARTLSSLLQAGVDIVQAMEITQDVVQNHYFKAVIEKVKERIKKGEPISTVFAENVNLYPVFFSEMVSIGEETGKLGEMLTNVASYYEAEVDQKTKNLSTIIEPVLMIFIGIAVAFFAVSILAPIYSLTENM